MNKIEKALKIAVKDLRSCYTDLGILTGSRGVYWSWDSFFASLGSLVLGDRDIVKKNLELYLQYQLPSGNIPKRIAHPLYPFKYIGFPIRETASHQKPSYQSPYFTGTSISQCPVLVIAFEQYIDASSDMVFLKKHIGSMERIFDLLRKHSYRSGLLCEALGGGWAESVLKRGAISYTNVAYLKSLESMCALETRLNRTKQAKYYINKYEEIKKSLNDFLWYPSRGGFYSDWHGLRRHHHFSSDGNLLAVLWNVADSNQSRQIEAQLDYLLQKFPLPLPLTSDKYYFWRIFLANRLGGIKDYHMAFSWLWLGCLAALVKHKLGKDKEARNILEKISRQIIKDKNVCEIYYKKKPVNALFYKCERPWAWSAGMFIYACNKLGIAP